MVIASPRLRALLLTLPLLGAGCSDSNDDVEEEAWDGTYTPLVDPTDWVDRGPYATCTLTVPVGTVVDDCGAPSLFDLTSCDGAALASLEDHGIYQALMRPDTANYLDFAGIRVPEDGTPGTLNNRPLTRQQLAEGFILSSRYTQANTPRQTTLVGCDAPSSGLVTGCYLRCNNGKVTATGTFEAARMKWGRGEGESSGGLDLLSENAVDLGLPADLYVTRGHAYVVSVELGARSPGGLSVFDVSNPRKPVLRKQVTLPGDGYWNAAWSKDDALYIASGEAGVHVFDITRPADPTYVRSVPGGAPLNVHTLFVDGDRLYAVSPAPVGDTLIFDISKPLEPVLLNRFVVRDTVSGYPSPHDSFAYEGRLYLNQFSTGYVVLDVKDPMNVQELGRYTFGTEANGPLSHASAVGTFAGKTLAFEGGEGPGTHLRVLDVTDPTNIPLIGRYQLREHTSIHNMVLRGTRLYLSYYQEGVRVLDVSVPTRPRELAYFNTFRESDPFRSDFITDGAIGIRVPGDGRVYVVDTSRGLLIFDEP
ncbi:hypothetical protein LZ198_15245 [Myxococcus sp. K15C18031901]|uniref:LVIVD repeat-containing protein n=1 Tax=Myxococcus dinghuensis TaxID=2906761 RepID=UPI0020A8240C|nr:hypothetical protein [Myxococcus dinghuensis]MCP3100224.1 hypothetical protein [Myxococcus dinghuensis]